MCITITCAIYTYVVYVIYGICCHIMAVMFLLICVLFVLLVLGLFCITITYIHIHSCIRICIGVGVVLCYVNAWFARRWYFLMQCHIARRVSELRVIWLFIIVGVMLMIIHSLALLPIEFVLIYIDSIITKILDAFIGPIIIIALHLGTPTKILHLTIRLFFDFVCLTFEWSTDRFSQ